LPVLPSVLRPSQLCSMQGCSIFEGAAAVWLAAMYLHQRCLQGFVIGLHFFDAFDRVLLAWVYRVLEAMGFGPDLHQCIPTLHRGGISLLLLYSVSPELLVEFSIHQKDPASSVLFCFIVVFVELAWSSHVRAARVWLQLLGLSASTSTVNGSSTLRVVYPGLDPPPREFALCKFPPSPRPSRG
jgi:hypothetical protein